MMPLICPHDTARPRRVEHRNPGVRGHSLACRYGITAPTVREWRECDSTAHRSHRPHTLRYTLSEELGVAVIRLL
jgi:hypothetical protein